MNNDLGLENKLISDIIKIFTNYPSVSSAKIFGSRAKGNFREYSDIDISLFGEINDIEVQQIVIDLDDLPYIYFYDACSYNNITNMALKEHIDRRGVEIYRRERL